MRSFILLVSVLAWSMVPAAAGASPQQDQFRHKYTGDFLDMDTYRCVIQEFRREGDVKVELADGRVRYLKLNNKVQIFAKYKQDFGGRKKLHLLDLRVGQRIQVTYVKNTDVVLSLMVLRPKKDKGRPKKDKGRPESGEDRGEEAGQGR